MSEKLKPLIDVLDSLEEYFDSTSMPSGLLSHGWGWHYPYLSKEDLGKVFRNFKNKLSIYKDQEPDCDVEIINAHVKNLTELKNNLSGYASNNANFNAMSASVFGSIYVILSDLETQLLSWDVLSSKNLLPKRLSGRCLGIKNQLDALDTDTSGLQKKIDEINSAHSAAEALPTDLALLKQTREQVIKFNKDTENEVSGLLAKTLKAKQDAQVTLSETIAIKEATDQHLTRLKSAEVEAQKIIKQCDSALQIATTEGIAAGFEQKAEQLRKSIYLYILGLVIALVSGATMGFFRVDALSSVLNNSLTTGQAVLHTMMAVFSIGGPLWLAWICTQQINHRFRLSEDYSYKATVSKSFMGFKKLAERFDPETEERLFNSTLDRLDEMPLRLIEGKDYNSPWHEFIDSDAFKKAVDTFPQLAREAGRFANSTKLKKIKSKSQTAKSPL